MIIVIVLPTVLYLTSFHLNATATDQMPAVASAWIALQGFNVGVIINGEFNARVDIPCGINKNAVRIWLDNGGTVRIARMIQIARHIAAFRCVNLAFRLRSELDGVTGCM